MKYLSLFIILTLSITIGCQKDSENITNNTGDTQTGVALQKTVNVEYVNPSGDLSGVTDADNIQAALNAVKADGGTVHLTNGHYYVSRNIFVYGFWGTLEGESMDNTIIEAVRRSAGVGFVPAESTYWPDWIGLHFVPTVLQLDYSAGDVTIKDLSIHVTDDNPADPYIHPWSGPNPITAISTLIEILGGDHNTVIENVRLKGDAGDARGKNVALGIHVMLGESPGDFGTGDLKFKNVIAEDIGLYGLTIMRFESSEIIIEDATVNNISEGIYLGPFNNSTVMIHEMSSVNVPWPIDAAHIYNSTVEISNADIVLPPDGGAGIYLWDIPSGMEVTGNTITGSTSLGAVFMASISNAILVGNNIENIKLSRSYTAGVYLWNSHDNLISGNHFKAVNGGAAGIGIGKGSSGNNLDHNNFVKSGLPGWTPATPDGPGAVLLDGSTNGNVVFEMMFPPVEGNALCQMIWDVTDDPGTPEYDGNNFIHHWEPCENIPERALMITEDAVELPKERMQLNK